VKVRRFGAIALGGLLGLVAPAPVVLACSPSFNPTIAELGPGQLVVVGTVGERVSGGRLFHVERWFNGVDPGTPIVIAFKEGEPVGDCSYPVRTGEHKIIAPFREADGTLYADLGTLQADPGTPDGQRYLAEAQALFGPGVVPPGEPLPPPSPIGPLAVSAVVIALGLGLLLLVLRFPPRRRRSP
jgi:hypothetical protein